MLPVLYPIASVSCLYNGMPAHFADSPKTEAVYKMLSTSQPSPAPEMLAKLYRPASIVDKTHIHTRYRAILLVKQTLPPESEMTPPVTTFTSLSTRAFDLSGSTVYLYRAPLQGRRTAFQKTSWFIMYQVLQLSIEFRLKCE